jgi:hypothetical protein
MVLSKEIQQLVDKWLEWDVNEETRKEIKDLVEQDDEKEVCGVLSRDF